MLYLKYKHAHDVLVNQLQQNFSVVFIGYEGGFALADAASSKYDIGIWLWTYWSYYIGLACSWQS